MAENDTFVQIAPDSTGKKVAVQQITQVAADGSQNSVQNQLVGIVDDTGKHVEVDTTALFFVLEEILDQLRVHTAILRSMAAYELKGPLMGSGHPIMEDFFDVKD